MLDPRRRLHLRYQGAEVALSGNEVDSLLCRAGSARAADERPRDGALAMRIRTANQAGRRKWLTLRQQEAAALKRALDRAEQRRELTQCLRALQLALHEGVVPLKPRRAI